MKQLTRQLHEILFHIAKCLACNAEKNVTVEDNKKRMNIATFINIYANIYTYVIGIYGENIYDQNKNDSINSILQHGCVVDKNGTISYFGITIFDPVSQREQTKGSYHLLSYKD